MDQGGKLFGQRHGFDIHVDEALGHLWVLHDGTITWVQLQSIKDEVWGGEARAIEVYPAKSHVVNSINCRHLWRLGPTDFAPNLLGDDPARGSLIGRYSIAWDEARGRDRTGFS